MWFQRRRQNTSGPFSGRFDDFGRDMRRSNFGKQWEEEDENEDYEKNWRDRNKGRYAWQETDYKRQDKIRWPNITGLQTESSTEQTDNENAEEEGRVFLFNLQSDVPSSDLKELFAALGTVKAATVHHDRLGRSLGTAEVAYEKRSAAIRALREYDGVPLDGKKMKLHLIRSAEELGVPRTGYQPLVANKYRRKRL